MIDEARLERISRIFQIEGRFLSAETLPFGNINATYQVRFENGGAERAYLLQELNTFVFERPAWVMENIDLITGHIRAKRPDGVTVAFYHTRDGRNYYTDERGTIWRMRNFIEATTFNSSDDLRVLRDAGAAFGDFQELLSDFDPDRLHETIPGFHDTPARLRRFFADAESDPCGRAAEVRAETETIRALAETACALKRMADAGEVPRRVTHNDTKANNVLFDVDTLKPLTVIDLDTTMPGLAMLDFGDAVRFAANTAEEDERDLGRVSLSLDKFRAFSEGFIGRTANALTGAELDTMALGAITITVELATRFLDDYLTGDRYFKTAYPGHNLVRARCQLALARDMLAKRAQMEAIVRTICLGADGR